MRCDQLRLRNSLCTSLVSSVLTVRCKSGHNFLVFLQLGKSLITSRLENLSRKLEQEIQDCCKEAAKTSAVSHCSQSRGSGTQYLGIAEIFCSFRTNFQNPRPGHEPQMWAVSRLQSLLQGRIDELRYFHQNLMQFRPVFVVELQSPGTL